MDEESYSTRIGILQVEINRVSVSFARISIRPADVRCLIERIELQPMPLPLIGVTVENVDCSITSGKYESNLAYSRAISAAGGLPVLLPQEVEMAVEYVDRCDGLLLTGGADLVSERFGVQAHPQSRSIEPHRQDFELALLDAVSARPRFPVLGVCLGMQLMAVHAGGRMNQHLPDTQSNSIEIHQNNNPHGVVVRVTKSPLIGNCDQQGWSPDFADKVISSHHQAVVEAGRLRVIGHSMDGVIEAIDDPDRLFYVGVQWHPERGGDGFFNLGLFKRFINACAPRHQYLPQSAK